MSNNKRSGKFYRKNEQEVMRSLGFKPTINSGSTWIEKEDGQTDDLICQLKSTDANSIKINKNDLDTLEYNSLVSHKLPVFAIQFLQSNEVYLVLRPEDLKDVVKFIKTGKVSEERFLGVEELTGDFTDSELDVPKRKIISSSKSRKAFMNEHEKQFSKKSKSAR